MSFHQPVEANGAACAAAFAILVAALHTIKPKRRTQFLQELCWQMYSREAETAVHPAIDQARQYLRWATPRARKAVGMPDDE